MVAPHHTPLAPSTPLTFEETMYAKAFMQVFDEFMEAEQFGFAMKLLKDWELRLLEGHVAAKALKPLHQKAKQTLLEATGA